MFRKSVFLLALFFAVSLFGQQSSTSNAPQSLPDAPSAQQPEAQTQQPATNPEKKVETNPAATSTHQANKQVPTSQQQPKRILGMMPNYRAVSAGAMPPPPTPGQAFKTATLNSFDYSSFVFVGITSAFAEMNNSHKQLGQGMAGFGRYYWRGFVDKTDGNYLVIWALPSVFHQDERYYALGKGGFWKRAGYSASRVLITPNYHGRPSFNTSELLGRAAAQGIATTYYPSTDRTAGEIATKWAFAITRDAATNMFREFWPDIATHVLHRHP